MPSQFPRSPRIRKGALAAYQLPEPLPTVIVFQYNPDEVSRSLKSRAAGAGRGDAQRVSGPPDETLTFTIDIDAADQLEHPDDNQLTLDEGLHPMIAALEGLLYPSYPIVAANEAMALAGSALIAAEQAPLALLIWGRRRVLPVQVENLTIKEQAFDARLNPIRVTAGLALRVQTYRDLDVTNPGYWVYMASFAQKEILAAANLYSDRSALADARPI